jgi:hypothetical protein
VEEVQQGLGLRAKARSCQTTADKFQLKEVVGEYSAHFGGKYVQLTPENSYYWGEFESSTA